MLLEADSESPDQTAHQRSLIWAFAVHTWSEGIFSFGVAYMVYESFIQCGDNHINTQAKDLLVKKKKKKIIIY